MILQKKISGSKKNNFLITENEGSKFSKISKDRNSIHTNDIVGYNSLFGKKICHGSLIFLNLLKKYDSFRYKSYKMVFKSPFFYNLKILFRIKGKRVFLYQEKKIKSILYIDQIEDEDLFEKKKINLKKLKFIKTKNYLKDKNVIYRGICYISYFAGMILPGQNSIINSIKFSKSEIKKTTDVVSKRLKNSPFFYNYFYIDNFLFEFETCIRPILNFKMPKTKKIIKNQIVKRFNKNVLIIGASSGIGREVLQIFKSNKKIYIFATYNKNLIKVNQKNIIKIKIDIEKNLNKVIELINKKKNNYLYYFASPKIDLNRRDKVYKNMLKNYYVNYPRKILLNTKNLSMFYPSSDFINRKYKNIYTSQKIEGEKIIKKLSKTSCVLRIPEINTKNNLSFFNRKIQYFTDFLNKNDEAKKLFFFKN